MGSIQEIHQRVKNKFFFFFKKKRNLDKVEKRKIITGSKCRVHLHTDSANLESNIEEEEATVPTTSS